MCRFARANHCTRTQTQISSSLSFTFSFRFYDEIVAKSIAPRHYLDVAHKLLSFLDDTARCRPTVNFSFIDLFVHGRTMKSLQASPARAQFKLDERMKWIHKTVETERGFHGICIWYSCGN